MPATLTPLFRFSPHLHTAPPPSDEASAVDMPIPLPPATVTTPWPPRRGGVAFSLPTLDTPEAAGTGAAHHPQPGPATPDAIDAARRESYAAGMQEGLAEGRAVGLREGAERRSWWDVVVGLTLGAALTTAIIMGGIELGMVAGAAAASPPAAPRAPAVFTEPMTGEQRA